MISACTDIVHTSTQLYHNDLSLIELSQNSKCNQKRYQVKQKKRTTNTREITPRKYIQKNQIN